MLRRQAELETLVVRGRKRGLCAVLGLQAITQLRAIYGHDQTATMAAAPATKLILRTGEAETARWSSAQIGEHEVTRGLVGQRSGLGESRDSFTIHPHRVVESVALAQRDPDAAAVRGLSLHHRPSPPREVTIAYLAPLRRHPGFILRITAAGCHPIVGPAKQPQRVRSLVPPGSSPALRQTAACSAQYSRA